jgi:shikimate kinase
MNKNVILVGPMGAGKSTIGRLLSEILQRPFVDTDYEIERRTGASIPWIFEKEGEEGFRLRETAVLQDVCRYHGMIVATGGGIVVRPENRKLLKEAGRIIYLYAPVSMQLARTARDKNRPLLKTANPQEKLRQLFEVRDPLYREVADLVVQTHEGSARELSQKIIDLLFMEGFLSHAP